MSTYRVSEETQKALIQAAGELFALRGPEAVSVRDITARAGVKVNAVSYHFGSKDGLIAAVNAYATANWNITRLTDYFHDNERLLATRDGQRQLVADLYEILFDMICPEGQPVWVNMLQMRIMIDRWTEPRQEAGVSLTVRGFFGEVYCRISGSTDVEAAQCWFLNTVAGAALFAGNLSNRIQPDPSGRIDYSFYRRIRFYAIRNALFGLGLADREEHSGGSGAIA